MSGFSLSLSGVELVWRVASIGDESVVTETISKFAHLRLMFEGFSLLTEVGRSLRTSERKHVLLQPESIRAGKLSPLSVIIINLSEVGAKLAYLHVSDFFVFDCRECALECHRSGDIGTSIQSCIFLSSQT
jgi:hypothetical protein